MHEDDTNGNGPFAWNDVTGVELDAEKARKAREEDMMYYHKMNVYRQVPRSEIMKEGSKVIGIWWIDITNGDNNVEDYRGRLVVKDFKPKYGGEDISVTTPPMKHLRMIMRNVATEYMRHNAGTKKRGEE